MVGAGELRWLGFPIYDASLWTSSGRHAGYTEDGTVALSLWYRRSFTRDELLKITETAWRKLGQVDPAAPPSQRLEQLASLITKPDNGWLSRNLVNRLWHRLMGRGLVHPVDSLRTRPWSEDLLDVLAGDLVALDWDVRRLLATIATSEAYAAVTPAVADQPRGADFVFAGPLPRRLTAEQFTDAVWTLAGTAPAKPDAEVLAAPAVQPEESDANTIVGPGDRPRSAATRGRPRGRRSGAG
jgi:hypothetical protein